MGATVGKAIRSRNGVVVIVLNPDADSARLAGFSRTRESIT
jgi:hypothetical protein